MLTTVLTWRSNCIVVKYIRKTSKICLSKLYIGTYSIAHDVITYTQNIALFIVKEEGASLSTPSFIIFFPFYVQTKRRKRMIVRDEKKHSGAVDESSAEQQFRKSDVISFVV